MIPTDEQLQAAANNDSDLIQIPVADLVITLWQRRRWLVKVIGRWTLISLGLTLLAFFIPNEYSSVAKLMPPEANTFSSVSMLDFLSGPNLRGLGAGGGLFSEKTPGATSIGVLGSRSVQDDIIKRFDLRRIYHCKLNEDARKALAGNTTFDEDKKTGIISITVMDKDRYLARDIAQAYIDELNKLVASLSTSSAHRERIFLEERLKSVKADLDASSHALSQFSSKNATFDPAKQGEATVEAATKLQGELITAESEVSALKAMYTDDNVRVREVRARIEELQSQLHKIGGKGAKADGADLKSDEMFPSVRQIPLLGYTYYDIYRQVTMNESIYETLTKQYEIAKVEEAKEIPLIKVLDPPSVPEKKSGPHRSYILIFGFLLSTFVSFTWVIVSTLWERADDSSAIKQNGMAIFHAVRGEPKTASHSQSPDSAGSSSPGAEGPG
ncbi:MAG TPA: GNVR domain-containing protein [Terracidiphilus sp.]|nr:GNVR domain-containing protein [Terracidiphilus sp.]